MYTQYQTNFRDILTLKILMVTSLFQNRKLNQAYLDDLGDSTFHQNHSTADKITVKQKQT